MNITLLQIRTELGLSRVKLAKSLGCNRASIAKWEKEACPRYILLACLALYHRLDRPECSNTGYRTGES